MRYALLTMLLLVLALCSACAMTPCPVGIMNFENATGNAKYQFLSSAVPEYLTSRLANYRDINLRERQSIARFLEEVDSMPADGDSQRYAQWQNLGKKIGADYLISGSVSRLDRNFVIIGRLFSVYDAEIVPGSAITATCIQESEIFDRSRTIADYLARQIVYGCSTIQTRKPATSAEAAPTPAPSAVTGEPRNLSQMPPQTR